MPVVAASRAGARRDACASRAYFTAPSPLRACALPIDNCAYSRHSCWKQKTWCDRMIFWVSGLKDRTTQWPHLDADARPDSAPSSIVTIITLSYFVYFAWIHFGYVLAVFLCRSMLYKIYVHCQFLELRQVGSDFIEKRWKSIETFYFNGYFIEMYCIK